MRKITIDAREYKKRRDKILEKLKGSALLLQGNKTVVRNHDVHFAFRQESNFFYLTGFEEPDAIVILTPENEHKSTIFVRKRDQLRETWDGFIFGPELTKEHFLFDQAYLIEDFDEIAPKILANVSKIYTSQFHDWDQDFLIRKLVTKVRETHGRKNVGNLAVEDAYPLVGEMRLFKSDYEVARMQQSADINVESHLEVMRMVKPGVTELALYGKYLNAIMARGAPRVSYEGIFASGAHATTLHYIFNDDTLKANELFLVDAGCEVENYSSDITRTYPISGKFNEAQKRIYSYVLKVQNELLAMCKPGTTLMELQNYTINALTDLMIEEKLLIGNKQELIQDLAFKKYYPHGVSHWLGLDVHDAGVTHIAGKPRTIEPGMSFTVEPGFYVPANDTTAPKELRGMGIRIEDDVVITNNGHINLTAKLPKEVADLEAVIGKS
jgi:Xaa-Pro aminopeptidase